MEHDHDNFHVRPFPQQPHRGGKMLAASLEELEEVFGEQSPNRERLKLLQAKIHESLQHANDDKLVDMVRELSNLLEKYYQRPSRSLAQRVVQQLLKVRIQLKHL